MISYKYNSDGYFIGTEPADDDQLVPGAYILAPNTTLTPPPPPEAGKYAKFVGDAWEVVDCPVVEPPVVSPIDAAVAWMESQGFSGAIKMSTLQDELNQADKAGTLESMPKLVATYTWMQTVKGIAKAGSTTFPAAPFTFDEVFAE